jgi:RecA-family ATPase
MFDPISPQAFEAFVAGGRFDSSLVIAPPIPLIQAAVKKLGLNISVKAKSDGSISMSASDLTWDTVLETQFGDMTVRAAMTHSEFIGTGKLRCQTPFRDSDSEAAFLSSNNDGRPFLHDSGTTTTHWLTDDDWKPNPTIKTTQLETGNSIEPLFDVESCRAGRFFDKAPPEQKWILNHFLPAGIVGIVVAPGGTGKSWFLFQVGASVATGIQLAGTWDVGMTGSVLMLTAEDDEDQLHRRMTRLIEHLSLDATPEMITKLREKLYIVPRVGQDNLLTSTDPDTREVGMTLLLQRLIVTAQRIPDLVLIIVDPASRFRGGNENAAEDVTRFIEALERIASATGATVLVAHHANKGAYQAAEQSQSASRGSSALTDGARFQLNLMTFSEKDAQKYGVSIEDKGFYLTTAITKNNYSAPQPPVILKRGEGGYLHRADLVSAKDSRADSLSSRVIALVTSELKEGRSYSKTGFANHFGGKDAALKTGNNSVRNVLDDIIKTQRLRLENGKLTLPLKAKILGATGVHL